MFSRSTFNLFTKSSKGTLVKAQQDGGGAINLIWCPKGYLIMSFTKNRGGCLKCFTVVEEGKLLQIVLVALSYGRQGVEITTSRHASVHDLWEYGLAFLGLPHVIHPTIEVSPLFNLGHWELLYIPMSLGSSTIFSRWSLLLLSISLESLFLSSVAFPVSISTHPSV